MRLQLQNRKETVQGKIRETARFCKSACKGGSIVCACETILMKHLLNSNKIRKYQASFCNKNMNSRSLITQHKKRLGDACQRKTIVNNSEEISCRENPKVSYKSEFELGQADWSKLDRQLLIQRQLKDRAEDHKAVRQIISKNKPKTTKLKMKDRSRKLLKYKTFARDLEAERARQGIEPVMNLESLEWNSKERLLDQQKKFYDSFVVRRQEIMREWLEQAITNPGLKNMPRQDWKILTSAERQQLKDAHRPKCSLQAQQQLSKEQLKDYENIYKDVSPVLRIDDRGASDGFIRYVKKFWNSKPVIKIHVKSQVYRNTPALWQQVECRSGGGLVVWSYKRFFLLARPRNWQPRMSGMSPYGVSWHRLMSYRKVKEQLYAKAKHQFTEEQREELLQKGRQMEDFIEMDQEGVTAEIISEIIMQWFKHTCVRVHVTDRFLQKHLKMLYLQLESKTGGTVVSIAKRPIKKQTKKTRLKKEQFAVAIFLVRPANYERNSRQFKALQQN